MRVTTSARKIFRFLSKPVDLSSVYWDYPLGRVEIFSQDNNRYRVSVRLNDPTTYISRSVCETDYPPELVKLIADSLGPAWLCDEIARDEDPSYLHKKIHNDLFAFVPKTDFENRTLLDFGCGSGASTMTLARLLPETNIVGADLRGELLDIARARSSHYGFDGRVNFFQVKEDDPFYNVPGEFDFIVLSAVYEHLLPQERKLVMPLLWKRLQPGGVMFIEQTPHRWFPVEMHTTGLPLINYLPDAMAHWAANKFSKRVPQNYSWPSLLRDGIRGGSEREIRRLLSRRGPRPESLKPHRLGMTDPVILWKDNMEGKISDTLLQTATLGMTLIYRFTGFAPVSAISLAFKKPA